ncbi:acyl-CoA dehydrogenase family protein [Sphingobium sp. 3R8]|uniref:acyl-CoA dehydrogenase family protein n=1 Tax=Sphingobium sp. 3R8 TaxID=2874921 RepID=UPI001CCF0662|nr:acyl-CoA dehydrogenase family protein [Sphingobium sp. 3R8]MBZ9646870.1 acyl-CoA dehydrogenase family protein [Sphingobium sp. 3R8]
MSDANARHLANEHDASDLAARVERFVRDVVIPYETDPRKGVHGPSDDLVTELRQKARAAGVLTPHIRPDGKHLSQRETAMVLKPSGLSPLGAIAVNTAAPDEGNIFLLGRAGTPMMKEKYLRPLIDGHTRSAFFMTEPNGAGSDPSLLRTTARREGNGWRIDGRKTLISGLVGATVGIIMAKTEEGATMFMVDLPDPAVRIERLLDTLDWSSPGGHAVVTIDDLRVPDDQILGAVGEGFKLAQVRLSPARLSHCMRWYGAATRANEIAIDYACRRTAFGKLLIDHEGVGFQLADNLIDLKQAELLIEWCADLLDSGASGTAESSMAKVAVSEGLCRVVDRCVQVMGGMGVTDDTVVAGIYRDIRAFRVYDGPTEVHKWSLAKKIKREFLGHQQAPGSGGKG